MSKSRIDVLTEKLRGRMDREGKPLPGYSQNVAAIRAEIALLQENIDRAAAQEDSTDGN